MLHRCRACKERIRKDRQPGIEIPLTVYTFSGIVREVVEILYNPKVIDYLDALPQPLQYEINDTLDYITTFGKQADLPDARRIVQLTNTWESRNQMTIAGRRYTIRILIRFRTDDLANQPLQATRIVGQEHKPSGTTPTAPPPNRSTTR